MTNKAAAYPFREIETKWQTYWEKEKTFDVTEDPEKTPYYLLTMFPYPSGAGLHVGHPLGYIAADILARYLRASGKNVLFPMGFDAFGLPAEQYAIQTGQHPRATTAVNKTRYRAQLKKIGLSFDWSREVTTSDPSYYKWTQQFFMRFFNSWYDKNTDKAAPISSLISQLEKTGSSPINAHVTENTSPVTAAAWKLFSETEKEHYLNNYRLAYLADTTVNWCPELGTVLANEEVKGGVSERGGHPVVQKKMVQWHLRTSAYADRLLKGLDHLKWPEAIKRTQRHWIGRSEGVAITYPFDEPLSNDWKGLTFFTTRPDTLFGVTFVVVAPEHPWVEQLVASDALSSSVKTYLANLNRSTNKKSSKNKQPTGVNTEHHVIDPFTGARHPVWISDYVLANYGTGALLAVPGHDERDHLFAQRFNLPIQSIIEGIDVQKTPHTDHSGVLADSRFLNGLTIAEAIDKMKQHILKKGWGKPEVHYRLRDAVFSRQRYWGEPFPVYYKKEVPHLLERAQLPLTLPEIEAYQPTPDGLPPLARSENWHTSDGYPLELQTMPAWAGSSWYFLRYMDPQNTDNFADSAKMKYWGQVNRYIGGKEHATGHLLYARFWCHFLNDIGQVPFDEPFQELINQGMIQSHSHFVYRIKGRNQFVSLGLKEAYDTTALHVDISLVKKGILDQEAFKRWRPSFSEATFILEEGGIYRCGTEVEKMSKSKHNVINPDKIIDQYGADTLRLFLPFLGPLKEDKPWNTENIEGVARFLRRIARFFLSHTDWKKHPQEASFAEKKIMHTLNAYLQKHIPKLALNTCISQLMIAWQAWRQQAQLSFEAATIYLQCLAPFAPHLSQECWVAMGHQSAVLDTPFPPVEAIYLEHAEVVYMVCINGKAKAKLILSKNTPQKEIESKALGHPIIQKTLAGRSIQRLIFVKNRLINLVI